MADRLRVYGAPWCPDCRRAKKFLGEHRVDYQWIDIDADAEGRRYVEGVQGGGHTIPTIAFPDGRHLVEPSNEELARGLGLRLEADRPFYDLAVIGGGPAGLAAAMYGAREGMETIVIERAGLGGQAGVTERIDNYPGFPEGIGGAELAERFVTQARRQGVELLEAVSVDSLRREENDVVLRLGTGAQVAAHAVLVTTGSTYRRLGVPGEDDLIGAGVHFCATCDGPFYRGAEELLVIGGGNSALEEGLFLAQFAKRIRVVQRAPALTASRVVVEKVTADPRFTIELDTEVTELRGEGGHLTGVTLRRLGDGSEQVVTPAAAFVFIGLDPNTAFLQGSVDLDERGFVCDATPFTTSMEGVFVAGDVRAGSTKQLASAAGDGVAALLVIRHWLEAHAEIRHAATG